jgi:hypothetical protein
MPQLFLWPSPLEQPERHGAFFFRTSFSSYGTLLGAALADAFPAISRDQVCVRLSSSITFDFKKNTPPNSDDNHHKKLRFPDRLNWPDSDDGQRKNSTPISFSPFFIFDENSPSPENDSLKIEVRHVPVSNSMIEVKMYGFQRLDFKKRCWLTTAN